MTCFWDGILRALTPDERTTMGPTAADLKRYLQAHNRPSTRCHWQGRPRTAQEVQEAVEWIRDDATPVGAGHDTSSCDPYLCLLVELLGVHVEHDYAGHRIRYTATPPGYRTLTFRSNRGHFW